jgi:surface protein
MLSTVLKHDCWKYANDHIDATRIVFTDQLAPKGVRRYDVSDARDRGVVRWKDGDTYYFSTQRAGVKVTAPRNCADLFAEIEGLETLDGTMLDTGNAVDMSCMFFRCKSLANIIGLQDWNVSNVTDMASMFAECYALENVDKLHSWDVSHVENMNGMFWACASLTNVNGLADWDVSHVTKMNYMFGHTSLTNIDAIAEWDVSNVTDMRGMFWRCWSLQNVDGLRDWNVSQGCRTWKIFGNCPIRTTMPSWYHAN